MNNICEICKATIDSQWSTLQNEIKNKFGDKPMNRLTIAFVERCIYCYKQYLEIIEKDDHDWYLTVMKVIEKRFGW